MCVSTGALGVRKSASVPLEVELQAAVRCLTLVRTICTLNDGAISADLVLLKREVYNAE